MQDDQCDRHDQQAGREGGSSTRRARRACAGCRWVATAGCTATPPPRWSTASTPASPPRTQAPATPTADARRAIYGAENLEQRGQRRQHHDRVDEKGVGGQSENRGQGALLGASTPPRYRVWPGVPQSGWREARTWWCADERGNRCPRRWASATDLSTTTAFQPSGRRRDNYRICPRKSRSDTRRPPVISTMSSISRCGIPSPDPAPRRGEYANGNRSRTITFVTDRRLAVSSGPWSAKAGSRAWPWCSSSASS